MLVPNTTLIPSFDPPPADSPPLELGPIGLALVSPGWMPSLTRFDGLEFFRRAGPEAGMLREFFHHGILHAH